MKRSFVLSKPDGSVMVMHLHNDDISPEDELKKFPPEDQTAVITPVFEGSIPQDRSYRNGWTLSDGTIIHDMTKCRDLHRDKMRGARVPKLAALDVAFMRAVETGDLAEQARIAAEKQTLRDVTVDPAIEAAQTVEVLKGVWPECLGAPTTLTNAIHVGTIPNYENRSDSQPIAGPRGLESLST